MTDRLRGVMLAFCGMLAVSTDSYFTRLADADGFDVSFWVGAFMAVVMFGFITLVEHHSVGELLRRDRLPLLGAGALQALSSTCFVLAVKNTSVSNVVVIIASAPLFAAGISWLWIRERTTVRVWVAIGLSSVGIALVMGGSFGGGNLVGDVLAVGAIATFGFSVVLLRKFPTISRTMVVGLGGLGMAVIAVVPATITGHSGRTWLALAAMGLFFGPLARVMLATAPRFLPATEVGLFAPVETVFATLWAFWAFGEKPAATTWIGGAVILASLLWGTWPRAEQRGNRQLAEG